VALRAHIAHVAISPATLQAAGSGWATALAASTPDDGAILALARKMCQGLPSDNNREPEQ
jgi:uroporphyrinogen-III synthase